MNRRQWVVVFVLGAVLEQLLAVASAAAAYTGPTVRSEPKGKAGRLPATGAALGVGPADGGDEPEPELQLGREDPRWIRNGTRAATVDRELGTVSAETEHLSTFVVFAVATPNQYLTAEKIQQRDDKEVMPVDLMGVVGRSATNIRRANDEVVCPSLMTVPPTAGWMDYGGRENGPVRPARSTVPPTPDAAGEPPASPGPRPSRDATASDAGPAAPTAEVHAAP